MRELEVPFALAGREIDRNQAFGEQIVAGLFEAKNAR